MDLTLAVDGGKGIREVKNSNLLSLLCDLCLKKDYFQRGKNWVSVLVSTKYCSYLINGIRYNKIGLKITTQA